MCRFNFFFQTPPLHASQPVTRESAGYHRETRLSIINPCLQPTCHRIRWHSVPQHQPAWRQEHLLGSPGSPQFSHVRSAPIGLASATNVLLLGSTCRAPSLGGPLNEFAMLWPMLALDCSTISTRLRASSTQVECPVCLLGPSGPCAAHNFPHDIPLPGAEDGCYSCCPTLDGGALSFCCLSGFILERTCAATLGGRDFVLEMITGSQQ